MKYLKKKERGLGKLLLVCALLAVLAVAAFLLIFMGGNSEQGTAQSGWQSVALQEGETEYSVRIRTSYTTIELSGEWLANLRYMILEEDTAEVCFAAQIREEPISLFDLHFNSAYGDELGYLEAASGKNIRVGVVVYDIAPSDSWTEGETELVYEMQEKLNDIIQQLPLKAPEAEPAAEPQEVSLETPYGVLTYLDMWGGAMRVEVSENNGCVISGYGAPAGKTEQHLFDVSIGGSGETLAGYHTGENGEKIPVYLNVPELMTGSDWTALEVNDLYGMQSVVNTITEQLSLTKEAEKQEAVRQDVSVDTPYGKLSCSGTWNGTLRIELQDGDYYSIAAYGLLEGKPEMHLFEIIIGGSGETLAGQIEKSGKIFDVYLTVPDLAIDESWTETERGQIYGMQSTVNTFAEQILAAGKKSEAGKTEQVTVEEDAEDILIRTSYGVWRYPVKWKDNLRTKSNTTNGYAVSFYARIEGKTEVRLFDIIVGGSGGDYVGAISIGANSGELYIVSYDVSPDENLTEEELAMIYSMQEDVNYTFEKMEEDGILSY